LNGISGGGLGATAKSALIEGCEMTEILGNAIQFIPWDILQLLKTV
jgi:hypothetical protein